MKKTIILLIILISFIPFMTNKNDYNDITKIVYVSSIGLEYDDKINEYTVYFYIMNYLNLTNAKISSSNTDDLSYTVKSSSKNFIDAFTNIKNIMNVKFTMSHLKTVIFHESFINKNNLQLFINLVKDNQKIYPNFYIYTTHDKINDIYNIKNFSDVSAYHTILITPTISSILKLVTFNTFTNINYFSKYTINIPHIKLNKDAISKMDEEFFSLKFNGYTFIDENFNNKTITYDANNLIRWLFEFKDTFYKIDIYDLYLKSGKYKVSKKKDNITIKYNISAILTLNPSKNNFTIIEKDLEKLISKEIYNLLLITSGENIDIFNLYYKYNSLDLNKIKIKVKLELN